MRIKEYFAVIIRNREHCSKYPIFSNKEDLKPIIARQPMEKCRIDLVVFERKLSKDEIYINIFLVTLTFFHATSFFKRYN